MNDFPVTSGDQEPATDEVAREPYEAPRLTDAGEIAELTQTLATGVGADGPYS